MPADQLTRVIPRSRGRERHTSVAAGAKGSARGADQCPCVKPLAFSLGDAHNSFRLGGSRPSSSPFEAEGPGSIGEAHSPLCHQKNLSLTNSGPSRTAPYGPAVPIGDLVGTSERHSCGGRSFDRCEGAPLACHDPWQDTMSALNSDLRAGVTRRPRRANNGSRAVSNRQGPIIIARVIEVARLSL
jgi:hypothetical protein